MVTPIMGSTCWIGADNGGGSNFVGELDQVLIYNSVLSAQNATDLFANGIGTISIPVGGGLILKRRYEFDEGTSTTVATDTSGNSGGNLILTGTPSRNLMGKIPTSGTIVSSTPFAFKDGQANTETGEYYWGDPAGAAIPQGKAYRVLINGKFIEVTGLDGHKVIDSLPLNTVPDPATGSYHLYSLLKLGAGGATVAQLLLAATSGFTPTSNHNGGIIFDGTDFKFVTGGNAYKVAFLDKIGQNFTQAMTVGSTLTANKFQLSALNTPPASATDTGTTGEIRFGSDGYLYVCTATNIWLRTQLTTW